jgi:hypothetical protein
MNIKRLDEERSTLRLILILAKIQVPVARLEFIKSAEDVSVGRTAFYSGVGTLRELGLIEESSDKRGGKRVILTGLTEKGRRVAELIWKMDDILGEG